MGERVWWRPWPIVALPTGDVHRSRQAGIGVRGGGRRARTHSMPLSRQRRRASATYRPRGRGAESRRRLAPGASTRTTREHPSPDARCSRHGFSALERRRFFWARWDASNPLSGLSCDHITAAGVEGQGFRDRIRGRGLPDPSRRLFWLAGAFDGARKPVRYQRDGAWSSTRTFSRFTKYAESPFTTT